MDEQVLIDIGLSKNEAKVYLALIELGYTTPGDVAKQSKVHRTNVYDAIGRLKEKGLVSNLKRKGVNYYEAADPEKLLNFYKEKEIRLLEMVPQMKINKEMSQKESEAGIYEGVAANRRLLEGFLKYQDDIVCYGLPEGNTNICGTWWIDNFHKRRIKRKQKMYHIYNDNAKERIKHLNSLPYTEAKFLPKEYNSPVSIEICSDEVLITSWKSKPLISILIKNPEIAATFRNYYNLLYKVASI